MVTVAVVGAGGMGRTHLNNLRSMEQVKVAGICDSNPAVAELAGEFHAGYYTDLDRMLRETGAEVVMIFTPTFLHAGQIETVLRAGRHCISEKPLCLSAREAEGLFALARQKGVHLYVAQVLHFTREYQMLTDLIRSGTYGRVVDAFFYRLTERPKWLTGNWMFDESKSGLIPYDLHIHELDFIVSQFGKPRAAARQTAAEREQYDHYRFLYTYPEKTVCAEASWYRAPIPFTHGYRICFERAVVAFSEGRLVAYEDGASGGRTLMQEEGGAGTAINVASALPYRLEIEHFLDCVAHGVDSDIVRNENVLSVLETLEMMKRQ